MNASDISDYVCNQIDFIDDKYKEIYDSNIKEKNINGRVLAVCNLNDLKNEIQMTFGDWELFKNWVLSQRFLLSKKVEEKTIKKVDSVDNSNRNENGFKNTSLNVTKEQENVADQTVKPKEEKKTPQEASVVPNPPIPVKPTRKVEFIVTPVNESSKNMSKTSTEAHKKNGMNDLKESPTTLPKRDTFVSLSSSNGSDYNLDSSAHLIASDNEKSASPSRKFT
jgi:hypothetical protein